MKKTLIINHNLIVQIDKNDEVTFGNENYMYSEYDCDHDDYIHWFPILKSQVKMFLRNVPYSSTVKKIPIFDISIIQIAIHLHYIVSNS